MRLNITVAGTAVAELGSKWIVVHSLDDCSLATSLSHLTDVSQVVLGVEEQRIAGMNACPDGTDEHCHQEKQYDMS